MFSSGIEFIRSFVGIGPTGPEFGSEATHTDSRENGRTCVLPVKEILD
jgi:hypothetical protein